MKRRNLKRERKSRETIGINADLLSAVQLEAKRDRVPASRWMQRVLVEALAKRGRPFKGQLRTPGRPRNGGKLTPVERSKMVDAFMRGVCP